jgi:O-antigen ligase
MKKKGQPTAAAVRNVRQDRAFVGALAAVLLGVGVVFVPGLDVQFTLPKLVLFFFGAAVLVAAWGWRLQRGLVCCVPRGVLIPAVALGVWWVATLPFAIDRTTALFGMHGRYNGLLTQGSMLLLFLGIASSGLSRDAVRRLIASLVITTIPLATYAAAQSAGWDVFVWPNIRPGSTIGHPVPLAAILSLVLPFACAECFAGTQRLTRWLAGGSALLLLIAIAGTLSRGPWLGLAAGLVVMAAVALRDEGIAGLMARRRLLISLAAATVVVAVATVPIGRVAQRLSMFTRLSNDPSFADRFVNYRASLDMVRDHPIAGIGLENYGLLYPRYRPVEPETMPADTVPTMVHNGYLQTAVTGGIPALLLYLALISAILWTVWRARSTAPAHAAMSTAFIAAMTTYLVQDLSGWLELSLSLFFWTIAGAAVANATADRRSPLTLATSHRRLALVATMTIAVLLTAVGYRASTEVHADRLIHEAGSLDVNSQWPQIDSRIEEALSVTADPHYVDAAGILLLRRFRTAPGRLLYDRAAALFDQARGANPFDPYIVINRMELETEALTSKIIAVVPDSDGDNAARAAVTLDVHNATVHRTVASFRLAQGRHAQALIATDEARRLRPHDPRNALVEGNVRRAMDDRTAAADAYRRAAEYFERGTEEWVDVERRLVVTLAEMGRSAEASEEARQLVQAAPNDALSKQLVEVLAATVSGR